MRRKPLNLCIMAHIPVRISSRNHREKRNRRNPGNLITINTLRKERSFISTQNDHVYAPKLLLTNTMSLAPKIDEVSCFVTEKSPDLACITETWLNDCSSDTCLHIPVYDFVYKNRSFGYIRNTMFCKRLRLNHLHHSDYEVLWV